MSHEHVTAIVTGGAAGIGRQLVESLLDAGARVMAVDMNPKSIAELQAANGRHGSRLGCHAIDLAQAGSAVAVVAAAIRTFGSFNTLVCNAGIGRISYTDDLLGAPPKAWEVSAAMWEHFFRVNTLAAIHLVNAAVPMLLAQDWGRIVAVTTSLDSMLNAGTGPYGPSKAGLEAFIAVVGNELADSPVAVNVLVPGGPVDTAMIPPTKGVSRSALLSPKVMVPPLLWLLSRKADGFRGHRLRAHLWDGAADPASTGSGSIAPIAWTSLARGQRRDPERSQAPARPTDTSTTPLPRTGV
jgi:3-oxoacyl-[acyl-carrier protein] reductase